MKKFLFFDYREIETVQGFTRVLERPVKHPDNPLFVAEKPWENGNMQLYGSVMKVEGRPFQMWYSVIHRPWRMVLAYAESEDGIVWKKPALDSFTHEGRNTNIVFTNDPHGPAVIYDADDPREDWRYKMVAGAAPSGCICAYRSPDGIRWTPVRRFPGIVTNPDCPMGFLRTPDGRYAVYHRLHGYGRRVFRSESWDFVYWTGEPRMVMEPDAGDPPNVQFYGMGSAPYGPYEIGTLWIYRTSLEEFGPNNMNGYQEAELAYARSGYAWHRAAQGTPFVPHGQGNAWDRGNLQCASAPVYLEDEIRYYYMGTDMTHRVHWELEPQRAGLGMAAMKPDRFVSLCAEAEPAALMTGGFRLSATEITVNACTEKDGWVQVGIATPDGKPIQGLSEEDSIQIKGDVYSHVVRWRGMSAQDLPAGQTVRLRIRAKNARIYAISLHESDETPAYHQFDAARL